MTLTIYGSNSRCTSTLADGEGEAMKDNISFSINRKFLAGMFTFSAIESLHMDYLGMEGTVKSVVNNWINWKFTVPIAFLQLALSVWWMRDIDREG